MHHWASMTLISLDKGNRRTFVEHTIGSFRAFYRHISIHRGARLHQYINDTNPYMLTYAQHSVLPWPVLELHQQRNPSLLPNF